MSNDRPSFPSRSSKVSLTDSSTIGTPNYSSILRMPSPHSKGNACLIHLTYAVNLTSLALNMSVTFLVRSFEDVKSERIKGRGRCTAGKTTISLYGLGDKTCGAVFCLGGLLEDPSHLVCATKSERTAAAALMLICYRFPRVVGTRWVFDMESTGVRGMTYLAATTHHVPPQPPSTPKVTRQRIGHYVISGEWLIA